MSSSTAPSLADQLRHFPVFQEFTPDQMAWVARRLHGRFFEPGHTILLSEQMGEAVYFVISGAVKVEADQIGGADMILAVLGPGNIVGEMGVLGRGQGRSANVVPLAPSNLMWMDRQTFRSLMREVPALNINLINILAERLRQANQQIRAFAALDVRGRVARQLLLLGREFGVQSAPDDLLIPLRLTQSDLAGLVGASRERVNRALGQIKRQHHLSVDTDSYFHLHNPDALAEMCVGFLPEPAPLIPDEPCPPRHLDSAKNTPDSHNRSLHSIFSGSLGFSVIKPLRFRYD